MTQRFIDAYKKWKQDIPRTEIAFLLLFAAEFTYYLLILQTGIVTYHSMNR